ncbi:Alanine--tRNA ligase [bioreactor metagenome]|uniref:Alanine--tRNA ligase n=1 Tax=bioreactor metagenome TaxID=1076179 RepID=A0A644T5Z5_9ZZZZ|nr:alanine--tRNA ligase [Methanobrevibacter sp.]MEA4956971.1 alanine--tRNA ligase [Methanobrevibacter sp.]
MTEILKELGFSKQKCETCGNEFWSIPKRSTCGDAPCDEYEFIGNPATDKDYDLFEIQKSFREFFEKNGHTPVSRYPVLAKRWRDDVFLVGASIYDFQPWVTSGLVEPPANPLVIAQPSIRLNDVDNVGRTGRHMTCFTMGAHHAFNSLDNEVYWKDNTVKLCHDFIVSIGIDSSEITFIESWWEGGGNAGPCYEVCVRGVELATLVFMQYKILPNGDKEEIPIKTVDTGYGLERFAWVSQGTPTAYDACFAPVINELKNITNIDVDENILAENAQIAGMMDIETFADIRSLREKVANKLNISIEELLKSAEPMEAIYIIADHTRCLAFMLADGIIPSNVKEGYLARLVLRRTIRFMKELKMDNSLSSIMQIQLKFLSKFYPEIKESNDHIMNIINLEEERYAKTIDKGNRVVKRTIKNLKKSNKDSMPVEILIDLYDAHGMPPETVKEISDENYGEDEFKVDIPDNFFTLVANQHSGEKFILESKLDIDYPPTDLLFYDNFNISMFEAEILDIIWDDKFNEDENSFNEEDLDKNQNKEKGMENNENSDSKLKHQVSIILDQTAFYPEGGGQPSDIGYLTINGKQMEVIHAEKIGDVVLHKISVVDDVNYFKNNLNLIGEKINGKINWKRRIALARNHTATHLIIAAAKKVLGNHIWQAGAQKGIKRSRLDLSHYKPITQNEIDQIEKIANELVMENISLDITWMSRDEAEKKYGFTLYQGGVVPGSLIRVVNIPKIDVQACAGTHVPQTGEIGLIKINKTERIQDGVERIDFSAGNSAIESMQTNDEFLRESSDIFKVTSEQLPKTCERFFNEWKSYKNELNKLKSEIANLKINNLADNLEEINGLNILKEIINGDIKELQKIATDFTDNGKADIVIIGNNNGKIVGAASKTAIDKNIKINEIIKKSATILGGGGGGRPNLAQGAGPKFDKIEEATELAIKLVNNELG